MSKVRRFYEITPPDTGGKNMDEREYYRGITCPYCHGEGGFWNETGKDERKRVECTRCEGVGSLMAEVTVKWRGDFDLGYVDLMEN